MRQPAKQAAGQVASQPAPHLYDDRHAARRDDQRQPNAPAVAVGREAELGDLHPVVVPVRVAVVDDDFVLLGGPVREVVLELEQAGALALEHGVQLLAHAAAVLCLVVPDATCACQDKQQGASSCRPGGEASSCTCVHSPIAACMQALLPRGLLPSQPSPWHRPGHLQQARPPAKASSTGRSFSSASLPSQVW